MLLPNATVVFFCDEAFLHHQVVTRLILLTAWVCLVTSYDYCNLHTEPSSLVINANNPESQMLPYFATSCKLTPTHIPESA